MAGSSIDIKRRIASTKSTRQITKAMQMVSGAKLNRIQQRATDYQIYADKVRSIVTHLANAQLLAQAGEVGNVTPNPLAAELGINLSELMVQRPVKKTGYLVITSDRGLVGGYNSTILKGMLDMIRQDHDPKGSDYAIMAVGGVGADFFKTNNMNLIYEYRGISDIPTFDEIREILSTAVTMYDNGVFDELYVCYNHHINSLSSAFRVEKMLPINDIEAEEDDTAAPVTTAYITDPSLPVVLATILPQFAESLIFGAILDAKTAEHASSMTAMKSASDNADDLISSLTTQLNRARQAQITTEITEIVGGAAALE
ncbi:F0F1 ATP synthase subunit gamma [Schleiferilactobacillus shenzhenensis]|uniref:ATP synthase gamma chain n=1 Tax=Schleiferilactobacillus shenzhenensis LY-73 TaxID=1231336 RepID=U4TQE8_9LACO|nr:F0F1 ATP synthase subunit gamma [Schleiferilactobacillus shenzhenensis]ERL66424.1 AtpG [Schleiferilactobacillus shenzhenensis LY-73]